MQLFHVLSVKKKIKSGVKKYVHFSFCKCLHIGTLLLFIFILMLVIILTKSNCFIEPIRLNAMFNCSCVLVTG